MSASATTRGVPPARTPWQELHRQTVGQLDSGTVIESAVRHQRVATAHPVPRDNH